MTIEVKDFESAFQIMAWIKWGPEIWMKDQKEVGLQMVQNFKRVLKSRQMAAILSKKFEIQTKTSWFTMVGLSNGRDHKYR